VTAPTWTSLADDPHLVQVAHSIEADLPPFLAELTEPARRGLDVAAPELQWVVHEHGLPVAMVRAVALRWSGTLDDVPAGGAAEALDRAGEHGADTIAVVDVAVAFGARGRGIGTQVLTQLEARRREAGLSRLLLLLRPHAKRDYPLVPFARYVSFVDEAGMPFDPWLRAAWRSGFVPVRGVDRSLTARAPLAAWHDWLGVPVPGSGPYLVDGAIKPAIVEVERDEGRYREPHLWAAPRDDLARRAADRWVDALAAAGVVAGDRSHREVRRARGA
jgi:GNAT superfamily N-acetyltransferase